MAGVAGFEPAHAGTKNRCLTAWLHPIKAMPLKIVAELIPDHLPKARGIEGIYSLFSCMMNERNTQVIQNISRKRPVFLWCVFPESL